MAITKYFVFDFDSTFTSVEALDELGDISLMDYQDKNDRLKKVKSITDQAMSGKLSFRESLEQRLALLDAHKDDLPKLIQRLKRKVSKSVERNKEFFETYHENVYIISNGFKDFIVPIVADYGIEEDHVFANCFNYDKDGNIVGFDKENILSSNNGKAKQIEGLYLDGEVHVIGDGHTDYEIREAGAAQKFYAFTENVHREEIAEKADHVAPSLDEYLYANKLNTALSYPKNRIKVLLLENIHQEAIKVFKEEGYSVEVHPAGLSEDELCERIEGVSILGIRSKTQVTEKVIKKADRLLAIGAFCIGTNQINLPASSMKGVAAFNAPYSNTRSVVELAIGNIIMLMRNLPDKMAAMHAGKWNKSATGSFEIRGKKLGIIGYGNIGKQLSVVAESIGLNVFYYDLEERLALGNATKCDSLKELLNTVDIVSLHVDGRKENKNLLSEDQFEQMKERAILINLSRGHVVDIPVLKKNIESGKISGAAVDVFPEEPKSNNDEFFSDLRGLPNVILTPHIGGSTLEAQENIASYVPERIINYVNTGSTSGSVNFPNVTLPALENAHRLMHIHENQPGILAELNHVLVEHNVNILGQYLKTNEEIGYVITDVDKEYDKSIIGELKKISHTIRTRMLY
ncbi:MAG: phosphoglycerate dehydrogenase [Bacteroidota bacterium]